MKTKFMLLLMALCFSLSQSCSKPEKQTDTPTNQIMEYSDATTASNIVCVCGTYTVWTVKVHAPNADTGKWWLIYVSDSVGHVISYVRVDTVGDATYEIEHQSCPYAGNCGWDITPYIYLVKGPKPVVGEIYSGTKKDEWFCPQCADCATACP